MKVLASPAFAMQPPTRNVSAATPPRATATPPTPASSARSGFVFKPVTNPRLLEQGIKHTQVSVGTRVDGAIVSIMGTIGRENSLPRRIHAIVRKIMSSNTDHVVYNEATGSISFCQGEAHLLESATHEILYSENKPASDTVEKIEKVLGIVSKETATV